MRRVVFFGGGTFGLPVLDALAKDRSVALVVSQPDRPAGRRQVVTPTPISEFAIEQGLPLERPESCNDTSLIARLRGIQPTAMVVIAYGQKLGKELLATAPSFNLHASLLPRYRGAAPIQRAVMQGDAQTGLCVIALAARMDAGVVYARMSTPIGESETAGELHDRLALLGPALIEDVLGRSERGTLRGEAQDESLATHAPKLTRRDGTVDLTRPAPAARAVINGLSPWPGCAISLGGRPLILRRAVAEPGVGHAEEPGTVCEDLLLACGGGTCLRLIEVQPPGGRIMAWEAYARGARIEPGMRLTPSEPASEPS